MSRKLLFTVPSEFAGKKLKAFLRGGAGISCSLMRSLKTKEDGIILNGKRAVVTELLREGDRVEINMHEPPGEIEGVEMNLDIIYEDDDISVINKPAGLAMHPTHNHQGDTLANAMVYRLEKNGGQGSFRAVGRLDKGTSGLVLCALNRHAAAVLQGKSSKYYYALVLGKTPGQGETDIGISRPDPMKTLRCADEKGLPAKTRFETLASGEKYSLLRVFTLTGRTHQIRVHMAHLGHPLAGDDMYGAQPLKTKRHMLHCAHIEFTHPVSGEKMSFDAPPPEEFISLAQSDGIEFFTPRAI